MRRLLQVLDLVIINTENTSVVPLLSLNISGIIAA
jgi:hypothetical protein